MSVTWTKEQQQVIDSRNSSLLVSAAAGSGKTAVLVERIIRMVTDPNQPLHIDQLLVMTFTNAAAAEMRERIGAAIEAKLMEEPENQHLQMQTALIHHAQITTIDSFCLRLIRQSFDRLDLDPSFRIGDEGELTLMREDVLGALLEDYYEDGREVFEQFVETYAQGKADAGIGELILQVYTFAQSHPSPLGWIHACQEELLLAERGDIWQTPWMKFLLKDGKRQLEELCSQLTEAVELCREDPYLGVYEPMLAHDRSQLESLLHSDTFKIFYEKLSAVVWDRLATVRSKEVDPEKKNWISDCRNRVKKAVGKMKELFCFEPPEEMAADLRETTPVVGMLLELAEEFLIRYGQKKRERNLVDFYDLEHEALHVLFDETEQGPIYSPAADELSRQYEEVLVDEYQDSNLVQEALLKAVSRERFGTPNLFMVGDVKQSIYKFRLARPELFLEKYQTFEAFETAQGSYKKIELHQNFRSRSQVLSGINDVFYRIMTKNMGNIRYTEAQALHPGARFEETNGRAAEPSELLLIDTGAAGLEHLEEEAADMTAKEMEARLIASRIRELSDPQTGLQLWDKHLGEQGAYRIAQFRDMAILLRSTTGWTETFLATLTSEGIPAYAQSTTGYFDTVEVETMLSLLSVIDNPMQDIPLAATLKSPIGGFTDEDLAGMMAAYKNSLKKGQERGLYGALAWYLEQETAKADCCEKAKKFLDLLKRLRQESVYLPIHELLYRIFEQTSYDAYVLAMPAGETRKANLDMLVEKAASYEKTSYRGLFHFIRYMENLKKFDTDFGEASTVGEEDDTVRLMSIHKSKGLEFPIVFLAGMGKKFNKRDVYGKVLIDPEFGIATDYLDLENRLKIATIKKNVLRRKMELENLGEELRVLYVAMTRAKEKLIMTGTDRYLQRTLEKYHQLPLADGQIPYTILAGAASYLDWVLMGIDGGCPMIYMKEVPAGALVSREVVRQIKNQEAREAILHLDQDLVYSQSKRDWLERQLNYRYPYEADVGLYTKMSVSELKKQGQFTDEAESVIQRGPMDFFQEEPSGKNLGSESLPDKGAGALRGTAYHLAMERLPFDQITSQSDIDNCLQEFIQKGEFPQSYLELIDSRAIWTFLEAPLGKRMRQAQKDGRLYKEQQFVMGIPAREMGAAESEELVVVQGIIDAYFEEDGQLVLMDYKTDNVYRPEMLKDHYKKQLDYYEKALTQMTGKAVKEKIIYSFTLQQEISCSDQ